MWGPASEDARTLCHLAHQLLFGKHQCEIEGIQSKNEVENHFFPISENKTGAWDKEVADDQPGSSFLFAPREERRDRDREEWAGPHRWPVVLKMLIKISLNNLSIKSKPPIVELGGRSHWYL